MEPIVYVVDDDDKIRDALSFLLESVGQSAIMFPSGPAFLAQFDPSVPACIVCDIRMPGMSGLELQQELLARGYNKPIVFITGHGDIPMAVEAVKAGAYEFLTKPFRDQTLLDAINGAIARDRELCEVAENSLALAAKKKTLTRREAQVYDLVISGYTNKAIAEALHLSHRTIEVHRSHMMDKMGAKTLPELLTLAQLSTGD
ncbi:MAG: response regulator transcription factor [Halioglobus sp.]